MQPRVPILAWHSMNVSGTEYSNNDHVAFAADLETIHRLGLKVVPVHRIVGALLSGRLEELSGCVGLTFDDAPDFDWYDLPHPALGPQRSMANVMARFRSVHGHDAQPDLHATSFAIVSPAARAKLDGTCMVGCRWWNDDWWPAAERSGMLAVECHSWDHNHATLPSSATTAPRGTFEVTEPTDAEREIGLAAKWLRAKRGRDEPVLFAYPYGHANDYLSKAWLPEVGETNGVVAAFIGDDPAPVTATTSRWQIPRFMCGYHWKDPGDLEALLRTHASPAPKPGLLSRLLAPKESPPVQAAPPLDWRDCLRTWEINDASVVAGPLFKRCFGHPIPDYERHFVLMYSPPLAAGDAQPQVVAYVHQSPFEEVFLTGGMCVDETAYRRMPRWLFKAVKDQGGLATIVTRDSMEMLGDSPAAFGHVGEPRARAADLRTGFVDTGVEHLMVLWLKNLGEEDRQRLIAKVAAVGPF